MPTNNTKKNDAFGNDAIAKILAKVGQTRAKEQAQTQKRIEQIKKQDAAKRTAWATAKHRQDASLMSVIGGKKGKKGKKGSKK
jgi:hypothetical protein